MSEPKFKLDDFYITDTDAASIREGLRDNLADQLGYVPQDSDPRMVEASAMTPAFVQAAAKADYCAKETLLSMAGGDGLDRLAGSVVSTKAVQRYTGRKAVLPIGIGLRNVSGACTMTYSLKYSTYVDGVEFSADGIVTITSAMAALSATKSLIITVYAEANVEGAAGDGFVDPAIDSDYAAASGDVEPDMYTEKVLKSLEDTITFSGSVTAGSVWFNVGLYSRGGADETDEEFAGRLRDLQVALRSISSPEYYKTAIPDHPGISIEFLSYRDSTRNDRIPVVIAHPSVTISGCYVVWHDDTNIEFGNALSDATIIGDKFFLVYATPYDHGNHSSVIPSSSISCVYNVPSSTTLAAFKKTAQKVFVDWMMANADKCGVFIDPSSLIQALVDAGASSAYFKDFVTGSAISVPAFQLGRDEYISVDFCILKPGAVSDVSYAFSNSQTENF